MKQTGELDLMLSTDISSSHAICEAYRRQADAKEKQMQIFILRHGQRQNLGDSDSLSEFGIIQSTKLPGTLQNLAFKPLRLWASSRKRTHQTLHPLSIETNIAIETQDNLLERTNAESNLQFERRVQNLLSLQLKNGTVLCTHIDWIEAFFSLISLSGDDPSTQRVPDFFQPGYWAFLESIDTETQTFTVIQQGQL